MGHRERNGAIRRRPLRCTSRSLRGGSALTNRTRPTWMKTLLSVLTLLTAASCPVIADQMTVGDLQKLCTSDDEVIKTACTFYIWGVTEGTQLAANSEKDSSGNFREVKDKPICLP